MILIRNLEMAEWLGYVTCMRRWLVLSLLLGAATAFADDNPRAWHRLVGLLQYLEGDYPGAVESKSEFELKEQRGFAAETQEAAGELGADATGYQARLASIRARIDAGEDPEGVSRDCGELAREILEKHHLNRAPKAAPDLERGKALFAVNCGTCHGADGKGDAPIAATMNPKPASFHDPEVMAGLTPYKVFNSTSFGITGTPMPAFPDLSDDERWAIGFFAFTLRQPACDHVPPRETLEKLATLTDVELVKKHGEKELACLRRVFPKVEENSAFKIARDGINEARTLYAAGKFDEARGAVVDAYLLGVEPIEPTLRARAPEQVETLEKAFTRTRLAAQDRSNFEAESQALLALLQGPVDSSSGPARGDYWSVFFTALLILIREGFEAVVVVGALLAVLKKMNAPQFVRTVHAAWVSALLIGAALFVFGQSLFAGANREKLETGVAFIAVGLLIYAAVWLNARSNMSRFMGELRGKMQTALGQGSALGLFIVAFTSVLRESVETALFLEGLAGDSMAGATQGALAGLVVLAGLLVLVRKVGFVLPMKTLFSASTALLCITAVMLLGKAMHGLQELGQLPLSPMPFLHVAALGLFPDKWSVGPQVVLGLALIIWWRWPKTRRVAASS